MAGKEATGKDSKKIEKMCPNYLNNSFFPKSVLEEVQEQEGEMWNGLGTCCSKTKVKDRKD